MRKIRNSSGVGAKKNGCFLEEISTLLEKYDTIGLHTIMDE